MAIPSFNTTPSIGLNKRGSFQLGKGYSLSPYDTATQGNAPSDPYAALLQEYLKEIKDLSDPNSPYAKQVMANATADANRRIAGQGIQGGLGVYAGQQAVTNAMFNNRLQLLGLQGTATGMAVRHGEYDAGRSYQSQMDRYNYDRQQQAAVWGLLGGVAGAGVGGLVGGPAGIAPGYQAGSSAVGGFGLANSGPPPRYNPSGVY